MARETPESSVGGVASPRPTWGVDGRQVRKRVYKKDPDREKLGEEIEQAELDAWYARILKD